MGKSEDQLPISGQSALMNACPNCGEVINVSSCAPYSKVMCPTCNTAIRVRTEFHHFSLQKQIGEGGMSRVFMANDNTLNRQVALKILNQDFSKDAARIAQFEKEARITAAISHPNVVKVFSVGKDQDHFFIAMELVPNGSLDDLIARMRSVPEDRVLEIGEQMAKGLKAAFTEGLIHRDMKPGNMLFAEDDTAKIVDFGLALVFEMDVDESNEIWATPYYVPPEKLHKEADDFRGDIYSLGASLFHALAGKPPYAADTSSLEELKAIKEKPVRLKDFAPGLSDETCTLIDRMMARQPSDRFASYDELIENFQYTRTLRANGGVAAAMMMPLPGKKHKPMTGLIAAVVVLIVLGIVASQLIFSNDDTNSGNGGTTPETGIDLSEQGVGFDGTGRTTAQKFVDARKRMLTGKVEPAAKAFEEIVKDTTTRQPTLNWARFNLGLCALMEGRKKQAQEVFTDMRDGGEFSDKPTDLPLAKFFVEVAEVMTDPLPVMSKTTGSLNRNSYEALALLAYGLKDWQFGEFNEADVIFTEFNESKPEAGDRWAEEYKALVGNYTGELNALKNLPDIRRSAPLDEYRTTLTKTEEILKQLKDKSPVQERVATRVGRLKHTVTQMERSAQESEVMRMAALLDGEKQRFEELKLSLADYRKGLQFPKAIAILKTASFEHPEIKSAYDDELYVWESAEEFLRILIADLKVSPFKGTIKGIAREYAGAEVTNATREKLDFKVSAGQLSMPLESVSSAGLIEMAGAMPVQQETKEYLKRQEVLVFFAYLSGELQTALSVSEELMLDSREFRLRWKQITSRRQS